MPSTRRVHSDHEHLAGLLAVEDAHARGRATGERRPETGSTSEEATRHLTELAFVELFRQGEVSSGWAARQLGISKDDFIRLLARHGVPYIDLSEEELRQQVEAAMPIGDQQTP